MQIDLTPEYLQKQAALKAEKELYLTLLMQVNDLIKDVKPNLEALYLLKIGAKKLELLNLEAEVSGLKYKMELLQAAINRHERINMETVDAQIEARLADYIEKIRQESERIHAAQHRINSLISSEETSQMKKLYYSLAMKLHPDTNPNLTDEEKQLWNIVANAYSLNDLQTLKNLAAAVENRTQKTEPPPDYDSAMKELELFRLKNQGLIHRISEIKMGFPFTIAETINDNIWIAEENKATQDKIDQLTVSKEKYLGYIELMMEVLK